MPRSKNLLKGEGNTIGGLVEKQFQHNSLIEWRGVALFFNYEYISDMLYIMYDEMLWPLKKIAKITGFDYWSIRKKLLYLGVTLRPVGGNNNPTGRKFIVHKISY